MTPSPLLKNIYFLEDLEYAILQTSSQLQPYLLKQPLKTQESYVLKCSLYYISIFQFLFLDMAKLDDFW